MHSHFSSVGFAHQLEARPTEAEFHAAQQGTFKIAAGSFIPSALFSRLQADLVAPPTHALFSGHILIAARVTNPFTGEEFAWAQVRALGGQVDVVADPATI